MTRPMHFRPPVRIVRNAARAPLDAPYDDALRPILSHAAAARARREIAGWPGYAPTPLHPLPDLARAAGVARIWYKDEDARFGLHSFKALGGAYAVSRCSPQPRSAPPAPSAPRATRRRSP